MNDARTARERFVEAMRSIQRHAITRQSILPDRVRQAAEAFADAVCSANDDGEPAADHAACRAALLKEIWL